jgi:hypothetical protein
MVLLDHGLINRARHLITGANVHRAKGLIFVYEQAVLLHNEGSPAHAIYQERHEKELRRFVAKESGRQVTLRLRAWKDYGTLDERNQAAMRRASEAVKRGQSAMRRGRNFDERATGALLLRDEAYVLRKKRRERGERLNELQRSAALAQRDPTFARSVVGHTELQAEPLRHSDMRISVR